MKRILKTFLLLTCLTMPTLLAAQTDTRFKGIHVFGLGTSFKDSTVYLSAPQFLPEAALQNKTHFMENRAKYAFQMKTYLEANYHDNETCAIFYAKTKKRLEKKYLKVRRRLLKRGARVSELPASEFTFQFIPNPTEVTITHK